MSELKTKNEDRAAFACCDEEDYLQRGLTKREYFAAKAMQALISNPEIRRPAEGETLKQEIERFSNVALEYADGMMSALEKGTLTPINKCNDE